MEIEENLNNLRIHKVLMTRQILTSIQMVLTFVSLITLGLIVTKFILRDFDFELLVIAGIFGVSVFLLFSKFTVRFARWLWTQLR